jgi:DNA-directed RNA polymerase specialized sigma24 family protein
MRQPNPSHRPYRANAKSLFLYRGRTRAILRKYFQVALETGRLPSLLGKQFFRTRVTSYRTVSFEDAVIFVHDVERSLQRLDTLSKDLIANIVLQGYEYGEAANRIGCSLRTVERKFPWALDKLSAIFLEAGIINPLSWQELDYDDRR